MRRLVIVLASGLLLAACSSDPAASPEPSASATDAGQYITSDCSTLGGSPTERPSAPTGGTTVDGVTVEQGAGAPLITVAPDLAPATEVVSRTLSSGKGQVLEATDTLTFNYCGVGLVSQQQFDSSWANGAPITYPLNQLIPGWGEGMPGMKIGEERLLIIPGAAGYGSTPPSGSGILPDESLAFVVQLLAIEN